MDPRFSAAADIFAGVLGRGGNGANAVRMTTRRLAAHAKITRRFAAVVLRSDSRFKCVLRNPLNVTKKRPIWSLAINALPDQTESIPVA